MCALRLDRVNMVGRCRVVTPVTGLPSKCLMRARKESLRAPCYRCYRGDPR